MDNPNFWYDVTKIGVTGLVAFLASSGGAYLGFRLSNVGKKKELLYKERYNSFMEIGGYLYSIEKAFNKSQDDIEDILTETIMAQVPGSLINVKFMLDNLIENEPNKKYTAILKPFTRVEYNEIVLQIGLFRNDIIKQSSTPTVIDMDKDTIEYPENFITPNAYVYSTIAERAANLAHQIYRDLELPYS